MVQLESVLSALKIEIILTAYHLARQQEALQCFMWENATFKDNVGDGWELKHKGLRIIINAESYQWENSTHKNHC